MDWSSIAFVLADTVGRPVFVLDAAGRVHLFNREMERLLGWRRDQVLDLPAQHSFAGDGDAVAWFVGLAIRGGLRAWTLPAASRDGEHLRLDLNIWPIGSGDDSAGIICVVEAVHRDAPAPAWPGAWLEISLHKADFGRVLRVHGTASTDAVGRLCHEVVLGREQPCSHCPVHDCEGTVGTKATTAVAAGDGGMIVVHALRIGQEVAQISHEVLDERLIPRLVQGRLSTLAAEAVLSPREHEVLDHLVLGLNVDEIAAALGISPRTVKFHQANLLDKLGIESRLELLRLLIDPSNAPVRNDR